MTSPAAAARGVAARHCAAYLTAHPGAQTDVLFSLHFWSAFNPLTGIFSLYRSAFFPEELDWFLVGVGARDVARSAGDRLGSCSSASSATS